MPYQGARRFGNVIDGFQTAFCRCPACAGVQLVFTLEPRHADFENSSRLVDTMHRKRRRSKRGRFVFRLCQHAAVECQQAEFAAEDAVLFGHKVLPKMVVVRSERAGNAVWRLGGICAGFRRHDVADSLFQASGQCENRYRRVRYPSVSNHFNTK